MHLFSSRLAAFSRLRLFALLCATLASAENVHAIVFTVTTVADSGAGSLRQALADANNGDVIQFASALNGQTIALTSAELVIDTSVTIVGLGSSQLTIRRSTAGGTPGLRIFHVLPGLTVKIQDLKISGGFCPESGGGVFNDQATLTLDRCAVEGNYSGGGTGGGIYSSGTNAVLTILNSTVGGNLNSGINQGGGGQGAGISSNGTLTLTNTSVSGNSVTTQPPSPGRTGGIFSSGKAEINRSSVSGNTSGTGGGGITNAGPMVITDSFVGYNTNALGGFGGGIENLGTLEIRNSTISGNRAVFKQSGFGGGIYNGEILIITNSTITDNSADGQGGGINTAGGTLEIANTILNAGTQGANIHGNPGTVDSHGYNLSSDNAGGFLTGTGDQINTNPMLGPLANNGGPTATHALLAGSPAINAGDPNFNPPPLYDQRGPLWVRVFGGRIDIGALEVQPTAPTPTPSPLPCANPLTGYDEDFDSVETPALPPGWTATNAQGPAPLWVTSNAGDPLPPADTLPNAVFVGAPEVVSDKNLDSPSILMFGTNAQVTFRHNFDFESGADGGVLEISINDEPFEDVMSAGGRFDSGGYNAMITPGSGNPLAGHEAWSGNSNGFMTTSVTLPVNTDFRPFRLRWRMGSNASVSSQGWRVDTVSVRYCPKPIFPSPTPTIPPSPTPTATPSPTLTPAPTPPPTPSPTATPLPAPARTLNISTRLRVETGQRIAAGGFIISGSAPKRVAIRGLGPSLGSSGLSDLLFDPILVLGDNNGSLTQNDNWQDNPAQAAELISLGLGLQDPRESGIVVTLSPGAYTAVMAGNNQTSGTGLVEVYDVDASAGSQLANISTRGFVGTGDNVMIGGFILGESSVAAHVAVRGIGPSLDRFNLDPLADPTVQLRDANGALLVANDNWQDDPVAAAQLTAHGLPLIHHLESGIFVTLPPGLFTAIMADKNADVGIGLVEIYNVQ